MADSPRSRHDAAAAAAADAPANGNADNEHPPNNLDVAVPDNNGNANNEHPPINVDVVQGLAVAVNNVDVPQGGDNVEIGALVIEGQVENNNNNNNNSNNIHVVTQPFTQFLAESGDENTYSSPSSTLLSSSLSLSEEEDKEEQENVGQEEEEDSKEEQENLAQAEEEDNKAEEDGEDIGEDSNVHASDSENPEEPNVTESSRNVATHGNDNKKEKENVALSHEDEREDCEQHNVEGANVQHNKSEEDDVNKDESAAEELSKADEPVLNPEVEEHHKTEEHNVAEADNKPRKDGNKISYIDLNYHSRFRDEEVCRMFVTSHFEGASMSEVEAKRRLVDAVLKRSPQELVLNEAMLGDIDPMFHEKLKGGLFQNLKAALHQCRKKERNKEKIAPFDRFCNIPRFSEDEVMKNLGEAFNCELPGYTMTVSYFRYVLHDAHMRGLGVIDVEEFNDLILERVFIDAKFPDVFINLPNRPDSVDIQDDLSLRATLTPLFYKGLFPTDNLDYNDIKRKFSKCKRFRPLCQKHVVMCALLYIKRGMLERSHNIRDQQYHQFGDEVHNIADRRNDLLEDPHFKADLRTVSSCVMLYVTIRF